MVGAPGITAEQKKTLDRDDREAGEVDGMDRRSSKQKGWDDAYLAGDEFAKFLKQEQTRASADVLKTIGLVK